MELKRNGGKVKKERKKEGGRGERKEGRKEGTKEGRKEGRKEGSWLYIIADGWMCSRGKEEDAENAMMVVGKKWRNYRFLKKMSLQRVVLIHTVFKVRICKLIYYHIQLTLKPL